MQDWFNICKSINLIDSINRIKGEMITSIDASKSLKEIQHSFMIKVLKKQVIEESHLKIIKSNYMINPQPVNLMGKKENISSTIRNKTRSPLSPLLFTHWRKDSLFQF